MNASIPWSPRRVPLRRPLRPPLLRLSLSISSFFRSSTPLRERDPLTSPLRELSLSTSQIDISSLVTVS